jgi:hypothetical protein
MDMVENIFFRSGNSLFGGKRIAEANSGNRTHTDCKAFKHGRIESDAETVWFVFPNSWYDSPCSVKNFLLRSLSEFCKINFRRADSGAAQVLSASTKSERY